MSGASSPRCERLEIAIAVVARDGQYLIGKRPEGAALAGLWEFPGGKVKPGEAADAAAVRECLEETGLAVRATDEFPAVDYDYAHGRLRLRFFACTLSEQYSLGEGAVSVPARFRWVPVSELSAYEFPPANRALLAHLQASGS